MALPLLPGNSFNRNVGKEKYHKSHYFESKNEVNFMFGNDKIGIGGDPLPGQRIDAPTSKYPSGDGSRMPAWIAFDKQVLFFDAFFQEAVNERREEQYRIRECKIIFYLEDDTIQVIEPRTRNSCLPQGTIIRRHRIARPAPNDHLFYTVHDFNIGIDLEFYNRVFHIVSCDEFTHNFLRKLGVKVGAPESVPLDNYNLSRKAMNEAMQPLRPYERKDKLKQFLDHDRHVLRFFCYWDDTESMYGDRREMVLHYFLSDDTMEVREIIGANSGRDAASTFLRRQKMPKNLEPLPAAGAVADRTLLNVLGHPQRGGRYMLDSLKTGELNTEFYRDSDLQIGAHINVYGREFVITDADAFTKEYYMTRYGISLCGTSNGKTSESKLTNSTLTKQDPPFNGWGSVEDSLGNCEGLMPEPPSRDFMKFMEKDSKGLESNILRFKSRLVTEKELDKERRFIMSFYLADDSLVIYEVPGKNTGFLGGKFLERGQIKKPGQEFYTTEKPIYYTSQDFYIGAIVEINRFNFFIEDADEYAYRYMERNYQQYPQSNIERILLKLRHKLMADRDGFNVRLKNMENKAVSNENNCLVGFNQLQVLLRQYFNEQELSDHEICTIARFYANRPSRDVNQQALMGVAQQYLRKVNFDEFQSIRERFACTDRRNDGYFHRNDMMTLVRVFHLPLSSDLLELIFDQCVHPTESDYISSEKFLGIIDWRVNPQPAPASEAEALPVDDLSFVKGKCVEMINGSKLLSHLFEK